MRFGDSQELFVNNALTNTNFTTLETYLNLTGHSSYTKMMVYFAELHTVKSITDFNWKIIGDKKKNIK